MAKKSKHKKHKMGGMKFSATSPLVKWGSVVLGFLAGKPINTGIDGIVPAKLKANANYQKIAAGVQTLGGAFLTFKKGKRKLLPTIVGGVALGSGAKRALDAFSGKVGGYGSVDVVTGKRRLNGYGDVEVVGKRLTGYIPNSSLGGYNPNSSLGDMVHKKVMGGYGAGSDLNSDSR